MGNPSGAQDFIAFAISGLRALLVVTYLMSSLRNPAGSGKQSVWHGRTRWVHLIVQNTVQKYVQKRV
jgi:hypothetical protein